MQMAHLKLDFSFSHQTSQNKEPSNQKNKQLLKSIISATNYLIWINNFEFLKDSIWILLRDKRTKRKCLFFIEEHI